MGVVVLVDHLGECARDTGVDTEFLEKFARNAVVNGFPWVEFSTGELPVPPKYSG